MGGDKEPWEVSRLAQLVQEDFKLATAWYSGKSEISTEIDKSYFNYIKIGPYTEELGPLSSPTTNQKMYRVITFMGPDDRWWSQLTDITFKFWKKHE